MTNCACFSATEDRETDINAFADDPLDGFAEIRHKCLALRKILIPDEIWPNYVEWHQQDDEQAAHRSICVLAYRRGLLAKVTGPIHRYLLTGNGIVPNARKQYLKDLREKWVFDRDPLKRHKDSKTFQGRLIELQYAEWLERQGHSIVALEATGQGPDIQATNGDELTSYEVKFIGTEDGDFEASIESMRDEPAGCWVSSYNPVNYLLFRVYEAALQLASVSGKRTIAVIIDPKAFSSRFTMQLEGGWLNFTNPKFLHIDEQWKLFMERQRGGCPSKEELRDAIQKVDYINIYQQNASFEFTLEHRFS